MCYQKLDYSLHNACLESISRNHNYFLLVRCFFFFLSLWHSCCLFWIMLVRFLCCLSQWLNVNNVSFNISMCWFSSTKNTCRDLARDLSLDRCTFKQSYTLKIKNSHSIMKKNHDVLKKSIIPKLQLRLRRLTVLMFISLSQDRRKTESYHPNHYYHINNKTCTQICSLRHWRTRFKTKLTLYETTDLRD